MSNHAKPRITAAALTAAATRLWGTVVLDLADLTVGPAVYLPRMAAFATVEGEELGEDDGTLVVLVQPGEARDLIATYGTAAAAASALTAELRQAGAL